MKKNSKPIKELPVIDPVVKVHKRVKRFCTPCAAKRLGMMVIGASIVLGMLILTASPEEKEHYVKLFHSAEYSMNAVLLAVLLMIE